MHPASLPRSVSQSCREANRLSPLQATAAKFVDADLPAAKPTVPAGLRRQIRSIEKAVHWTGHSRHQSASPQGYCCCSALLCQGLRLIGHGHFVSLQALSSRNTDDGSRGLAESAWSSYPPAQDSQLGAPILPPSSVPIIISPTRRNLAPLIQRSTAHFEFLHPPQTRWPEPPIRALVEPRAPTHSYLESSGRGVQWEAIPRR